MLIEDPIYGKQLIKDNLIEALITCGEFTRLKKLNCNGVPDKYYNFTGYSRFDHSIGVYLLLGRFGATYKEQVAGLLHDISHKAFSHIYDWVIKDQSVKGDQEDAQDKLHPGMVKSKIAEILGSAGFVPSEIFDLSTFSLLDKEIPELCADRIDYSLRSVSLDQARRILLNLFLFNGKIVCTNYESAKEYGNTFLDLQNNNWGSVDAVSRYYHFSELLKKALGMKIITLKSFDLDDEALLDTIYRSGCTEVLTALKTLESVNTLKIAVGRDKKTVYKKFRYIDPEFIAGGRLERLSVVDKAFRAKLTKSMASNRQGVSFYPLW
jgi:uncharacterized protein